MAFDIVPGRFWSFPTNRMISSLFDDLDSSMEPVMESSGGLSVSEDEKHVYVEAALPGINPEDVEIVFEKGVLWIKGESVQEEKNKQRKFYRQASSSFSYRVAVPGDIDTSVEPEAESEHGVMKVTFVKSAKAQPKKIAIKKK